MRWAGIHQRAEHHLTAPRAVLFPLIEDLFYLLSLQPVLRSTEVTGDNRILHCVGEFFAIDLGHMGEGAIDK